MTLFVTRYMLAVLPSANGRLAGGLKSGKEAAPQPDQIFFLFFVVILLLSSLDLIFVFLNFCFLLWTFSPSGSETFRWCIVYMISCCRLATKKCICSFIKQSHWGIDIFLQSFFYFRLIKEPQNACALFIKIIFTHLLKNVDNPFSFCRAYIYSFFIHFR